MKSLWFKQRYVADILDGGKTDTIRRAGVMLPVGAIMPASVGPRRPFALLRIMSCDQITIDDMREDRRAEVLSLYPDESRFTHIVFRVHHD